MRRGTGFDVRRIASFNPFTQPPVHSRTLSSRWPQCLSFTTTFGCRAFGIPLPCQYMTSQRPTAFLRRLPVRAKAYMIICTFAPSVAFGAIVKQFNCGLPIRIIAAVAQHASLAARPTLQSNQPGALVKPDMIAYDCILSLFDDGTTKANASCQSARTFHTPTLPPSCSLRPREV